MAISSDNNRHIGSSNCWSSSHWCSSQQLRIKGECPACKRQFIRYKSQVIRCEGSGNIVWQPQGDFFSKDGNNNNKGNSKKSSKSQIIDVDFEEK